MNATRQVRMEISDRMLFLKYALPCAGTLVKRGVVSQVYVDGLIRKVSSGELPEAGAESIFKVANAMCGFLARKEGKSIIDSGVIRDYFLMKHSEVVDERYALMKDFNPADCRTYAGRVLKAAEGRATVDTPLGEREYRTDFCKDAKEGDTVAVHFDFVIEKVSAETASRMALRGR